MSEPLFVREDGGTIKAKPGIFYPYYLGMIGAQGSTQVTQVQLEVARLLFTEDLFQVFGKPLHLRILKDDKYRLDRYPAGEGNIRALALALFDSLPGTSAKRLGLVA